MKEKYIHCFARKRLAENGIKFYHNGSQILPPINATHKDMDTEERWNYGEFITQLKRGVPLQSDIITISKSRIMRSYEELQYKTGLKISSRRPTFQRFIGQKTEYYLCMADTFRRDVGEIPRGHQIEVDFQNRRARLLGANSLGSWFVFKKSPTAGKGIYGRHGTFWEEDKSFQDMTTDFLDMPKNNTDSPIIIKDIVVGISLEDGRIVGIPEENFNPVIFICGKRRSGKTMFHYRLLGNIYHKWRKKCIDLIDIAHEAESHSLEWKQKSFINWLSIIGEKTRAMPLVYLTPSTNNLKNIPLKDEVGIRISLPYDDIIYDYESVFRGNKAMEFEKTATYFNNMLFDEYGNKKEDGLANCKNPKNAKSFIKSYLSENSKKYGIKNPEGVTSKIYNAWQYLYNTKILDISWNEDARWEIEFQDGSREKFNSWIACLIADVCATINISNLRWHPLYPVYMAYILKDIYKNQTENPLFIRNNSEIFLFLNEVSSVVYDEITKRFTLVSDVLDMIIRESGPNRIGVVFGTQFLDQVSSFSKSQANYVFSFKQNESGAEQLIRDYDALKDLKSDLKRLETFECIGFPSGSPFNLYDENGKVEKVIDEPIRMKIFPPLSAHKPPKDMNKGNVEEE